MGPKVLYRTGANKDQRLAMLNLLSSAVNAESSVQLTVDSTELMLPSPTYTIDTLIHFRKTYGDTIPLLFILGQDAFQTLEAWKQWQKIIQYCHLVVMPREAQASFLSPSLTTWLPSVSTTCSEMLKSTPCGRVFFAKSPLITISSSEIRAMIVKNSVSKKPWETPWLHPVVNKFIQENKLYLP